MSKTSWTRMCHLARPHVWDRTGWPLIVLLAVLGGCGGPTIERYGGNEYIFLTEAGTWPQGRDACVARGFRLVDIADRAENRWLRNAAGVYGEEPWWIGLNDRVTEGEWVWESGAPVTYDVLQDEEPDASSADCATLYPRRVDTGWMPTQEWAWTAMDCENWYAPVCER